MAHKMRWKLSCAVLLVFCLLLVGCGQTAQGTDDSETDSGSVGSASSEHETSPESGTQEIETGIVPNWDDTSMNGLCLVLPGAKQSTEILIDLAGIMNVQAVRHWIHATDVLNSPGQANADKTEQNRLWLTMLQQKGISKIVGMSHYWFQPESVDLTGIDTHNAQTSTPYRDPDDPTWQEFLALYEETWYTLAKTYPEILFWEVGNEVNSDGFLHPYDYASRGRTFTQDEKAEIVTDMCYYASRGIHRANPQAIVIFPGLAPLNGFSGMATFLERIYRNIESGRFGEGATDVNCYFQAVAWHGYVLQGEFNVDDWIAGNNQMYAVMQKHGDGDKKVFLTEFGFSDGGSRETDLIQAGYYEQIFARLDEMPYLDSVYPFRLMEYKSKSNTDPVEIYYGMMRPFDQTHIGAKEKGKTICSLYGGDLSQLDKYLGDNTVYPDNGE